MATMFGRARASAIAGAVLFAVAALGAGLAPLHAEQRQRPEESRTQPGTRSHAPIPATKGGIRGRVIDHQSGNSIERAIVAVVNGLGHERVVMTGRNGRFGSGPLEPDVYRVYAKADGYVAQWIGADLPEESGTEVEIVAGRITSGVTVRLRRAGAIGGRVFDDSGNGFADVEIELLRRQYLPRGMTWTSVAFDRTDALGRFQVSELRPAEYQVKAYTPGRAGGNIVYAPTYFPGTTRPAEALPMVLSAGQELFGVDFALLAVETVEVTGVVVDPVSPALGGTLVRHTRADSAGLGETVPVAADGSFRISGLIPADYVLRAIPSDLAIPPMALPGARVTVDDDLSDVSLVVHRGARLEGRIVADNGRPLTFDPSGLRVGMEMRPGDGGIVLTAPVPSVRPDGTFYVDGAVQPATLHVSELPPPWAVRAVRLNGRDITHDATDFGTGVVRGMRVILTDQPAAPTEVSGSVTDRRGNLVSNYIVVVFPEHRARWVPPSPFVSGTRPGRNGRYRVQELPPADYLAVAVESLPDHAWADSEVLDQLWSQATRFRLDEGSQVTLNLRLARTPAGLRVAP